jgi:hypothetical protein
VGTDTAGPGLGPGLAAGAGLRPSERTGATAAAACITEDAAGTRAADEQPVRVQSLAALGGGCVRGRRRRRAGVVRVRESK